MLAYAVPAHRVSPKEDGNQSYSTSIALNISYFTGGASMWSLYIFVIDWQFL